jgi:regulator of sigma E protease
MIDFHHILAAIAAIDLRGLLVTIVAFIVLLGIMVVVHEFGHFAVAKLCKVRVEAFSVGFGPRLFGYKYGDTDYKVCLLPLGGFVKMTGEEFSELGDAATGTANVAPVGDPGALTAHPRWQRILIGLAGPVANLILAFLLMVIYFGWINEVPNIKITKIEWVKPGSVADQAGLQPGDIIRGFANAANPDWYTVVQLDRKNIGQSVPVAVERNGQILQTSLRLPERTKAKSYDLSLAGVFLEEAYGPIVVDLASPNLPAAQAGLQSGDSILAVDGHVFHTVMPLLDYLQSGQGKPVTLTVTRNGATLPPIVVHPSMQDSQWRLGFRPGQPAFPPVSFQPMSFSDAMAESRDFCAENSLLIVEVLQKLLTHNASVTQLVGPVGIAQAAGEAAETKEWSPKFGLAAAISINLGILNLLPFPILDGGMIFFLLIEGAIRRDINIDVKERIYQGAFVLLVAFFAFIIFNDVSKLPIFTHLKP